jgi:hypothetical protein
LPVRGYLNGERVPGQRAWAATDPFEEYVSCCRLRLSGDPRAWLTTLLDEVAQLGYAGSYQSFTRAIRTRRRDRGVRHAGGPGSYTTLPVAVHVAGGRDATLTEGDSPGAGDQVPPPGGCTPPA